MTRTTQRPARFVNDVNLYTQLNGHQLVVSIARRGPSGAVSWRRITDPTSPLYQWAAKHVAASQAR